MKIANFVVYWSLKLRLMKTSFNMKNKKILIGAAASAVIASALLLAPSTTQGAYQLREKTTENNTNGIAGAFDYYSQIRMNVETGTVNQEDWLRAKDEFAQLSATNRADVTWKDHGPDNVGGRTRAILIDINDDNHVYAGSVSGGLFESFNRGNTWQKVDGLVDNLGISSMCMTDNGNIYVATGHAQEQVGGTTAGYDSGMNGDGVFVSTDNGASFSQVSGTTSYSYINEIVAKGNDVFIAASSGLKKLSGSTISNVSDVGGSCTALSISNDGTLIVAAGSGFKTYVSTNGGSSFTDVSGNNAPGIPNSGVGRIEYAVSHEKGETGNYYIYASVVTTSSRLKGVFKSTDNGATWDEIAPANDGTVGSFAPFGDQTQGLYDNIITVVPGNPDAILLGGIDVHAKSATGNWEARSNGFYNQMSPLYVHSDQHEMKWDSQGRLYLGNDGGVFFSDDNGNEFHEADRNYNVTQFYKIGVSAHGDVIGGAQDNGTQANYHDNATYREHDAVGGGDGFGAAVSFINRDIIFTSVYFGSLSRSGDRGNNSSAYGASNIPTTYGTPGVDLGSFNTCIELYENPNDLNSTDSVTLIPSQGYSAGDIVLVPSLTSQVNIEYTTPTDITFDDTLNYDASQTTFDTLVTDATSGISFNVNEFGYSFINGGPSISNGDSLLINGDTIVVSATSNNEIHYWGTNVNEPGEIVDMHQDSVYYGIAWDTIVAQDPYQSWFAFGLGNGQGVWLTRNALRLSASHDGFLKAAEGMTGSVTTMEFSGDGNHLFIGTSAGRLYRLSGLDDIYSPNPSLSNSPSNIKDSLLNVDEGAYSTTFEEIGSFGAFVTNIASDKADPDHLVVTLGNYGGSGKVRECTVATQAGISQSNFTSIAGNLPTAPLYSCVIDRNDPNIVFVGGDFGVYRTENGGTTWENVSGAFGNTPVFDMVQNWRTWDEGNYKPGEIYIGTHGRGIWSTDVYLSVEEAQDNLATEKFITDFLVYPNPVNDFGTVSFELADNSDVTVQVYSLTGKLVQSIQKSNMNEGYNTISIEAPDLPNGTYFVRLTAGDLVKTTKFIKQ